MICDFCGKPIEPNHRAVQAVFSELDSNLAWPKRFYHNSCADQLLLQEFSYREKAVK